MLCVQTFLPCSSECIPCNCKFESNKLDFSLKKAFPGAYSWAIGLTNHADFLNRVIYLVKAANRMLARRIRRNFQRKRQYREVHM